MRKSIMCTGGPGVNPDILICGIEEMTKNQLNHRSCILKLAFRISWHDDVPPPRDEGGRIVHDLLTIVV